MILADTSVWIAHFRRGNPILADLPGRGQVLGHGVVVGGPACGLMRHCAAVLRLLAQLPQAHVACHDEALHVIEMHDVAGSGIGYGDAHLLAATC